MTPSYYVPVLRWKRAEQKALGMIGSSDRERIIPLVELVPRDYEAKKSKAIPTIQQVAEKQAAAMVQNWDNRPIFIDSWRSTGL